jgi:hypothetical protein
MDRKFHVQIRVPLMCSWCPERRVQVHFRDQLRGTHDITLTCFVVNSTGRRRWILRLFNLGTGRRYWDSRIDSNYSFGLLFRWRCTGTSVKPVERVRGSPHKLVNEPKKIQKQCDIEPRHHQKARIKSLILERKNVSDLPVQPFVVCEDQVFRDHSIAAGSGNGQLETRCRRGTPIRINLRL